MTVRRPAPPLVSGTYRLVKSFWPEISKERKLLAFAFLSVVASIFFQILEPWPLKFIYDHLFLKMGHHMSRLPFHITGDTNVVLPILAASIVLVIALGAFSDYLSAAFLTRAASRILAEIRTKLFLHLANLSLSFHSEHRSGDLLTRITYDIDRMREIIITALLPLITNGLAFFAMLGVMFWINWRLGMIAIVAGPVFVFSVNHITEKIKITSRLQRTREGALASTTSEAIGAIKTIQALSLQQEFADIFSAATVKSLQEGAKAQRLSARLERTVEILVAATTAVVLWGGAQMVIDKVLTPGDLIVFINYLRTAFKPMRQLAKYLGQISRALSSADRILDLLHTVPVIRDAPGAVDADDVAGHIRFENVSFGYHSRRMVLRDMDFSVKPGQTVAIVGPSGSGKSTLTNLLLRFYDPLEGRILIDGRDLREYKLNSLRRRFSVVLQDSVLFAVSAGENISFGSPGARQEEIETAARQANAHEFIEHLPQGYQTIIGERGASLSGGQRQRVVIARAALRQAPVVILDEPTTGLDGQNESEVMLALERLTAGRTTLLISHNLRAVRNADMILYLVDGEILERGTHEELMARNGEYATSYILQSTAGTYQDTQQAV